MPASAPNVRPSASTNQFHSVAVLTPTCSNTSSAASVSLGVFDWDVSHINIYSSCTPVDHVPVMQSAHLQRPHQIYIFQSTSTPLRAQRIQHYIIICSVHLPFSTLCLDIFRLIKLTELWFLHDSVPSGPSFVYIFLVWTHKWSLSYNEGSDLHLIGKRDVLRHLSLSYCISCYPSVY